jgi:hypothetical protein
VYPKLLLNLQQETSPRRTLTSGRSSTTIAESITNRGDVNRKKVANTCHEAPNRRLALPMRRPEAFPRSSAVKNSAVPSSVQLLIRRPVPGTARVRADAAKLVVEPVQVFAEQPHHLHAEVAVAAEELQQTIAVDEGDRRVVFSLRAEPVGVAAHALAETQDGARAGDLQQLRANLVGSKQKPNLAGFDYVDPCRSRALFKNRSALGIRPYRLDLLKSLPKIWAEFAC